MKEAIFTVATEFKAGDLPPESGYLDWCEWAEVQYKAGIEQVECGYCGLWKTPQELSGVTFSFSLTDKEGNKVKSESPVCTKCNGKK